MDEMDQIEMRQLKQQIRQEKERVVAYWNMLKNGINLDNDELAILLQDISDESSDDDDDGGGGLDE